MSNDVLALLEMMLTFGQMMLCPADTNEKIQVFRLGFFWHTMADSNRRHQASEACALSSWANGAYSCLWWYYTIFLLQLQGVCAKMWYSYSLFCSVFSTVEVVYKPPSCRLFFTYDMRSFSGTLGRSSPTRRHINFGGTDLPGCPPCIWTTLLFCRVSVAPTK